MTERTKNIVIKILSNRKYELKEAIFEYQLQNKEWVEKKREYFDRGNGAVILLYNRGNKSIIVTKQFRFPTMVNGNSKGFMYEAPAGMIDEDESPEVAIIREVEEETGYRIEKAKQIFEIFSTPGAVTEKLYYFIAEYNQSMKVSEGGGLEEEHEDIEVIELPFIKAVDMMHSGEIKDAKTIILLQYAQINKLI